ncbi:ATP-dependent helicase HrpB [Neogemmobacter tilapiae]|uniref:DEAD/DEAH box helicase n=1 Tax=Neogemmobacter tilapiae TaxID=875041 RepID=A0A918TXR0_9RHOB|nr:ATP-dependent helicase HrpB [Gemmobacter tilapiae]GHC66565.1 DEAD/DEAH box helicase [Gemmobacter tilapiae]
METLPILEVLPELIQALRGRGMVVLQAPPGAGKTTGVPLALLPEIKGKIVMLEPRRLAARGAAERLAEGLGETVGGTVGYRIRGEAKAGKRIEVVTEGILTRMIQTDAELPGVGCLIFDEFHERSLTADLGLALALDIREALRPDLALLVMSATLDTGPVAALMGDAPVVTSEGRAFPVETRHLARPLRGDARFENEMAGLIGQAFAECPEGDVLAFLPGEGEIRRVQGLLRLEGVTVAPLFGNMDFAAQRAALGPAPGRKLVLATAIAETSLTIPGVRVVVDGGRARRARFDPGSGMARLVTERVTRAEAEQRRGRAGRVAPGVCYRLWSKGEEGGLQAYPPPEIAATDLAGLALELAQWGGSDLRFLTPPPEGALTEARGLLASLGALHQGRITAHGKAMAALPLQPRLAHMLIRAGGEQAALLAALLAERDPLRGAPPDLALRMRALRDPKAVESDTPYAVNRGVVERVRDEARRLRKMVPGEAGDLSLGQMAALAYPDRVGLRRKGDEPRWLLSGGKGAAMGPGLPLTGARLLVATDLDGDAREAGIRQAVALSEAELREVLGDQFTRRDICEWSRREGRVAARRQEMFGAIALSDQIWHDAPAELVARAALDGLRENGLSWSAGARRLAARVAVGRGEGEALPDFTESNILTREEWVLPYLNTMKSKNDLSGFNLVGMMQSVLGWEGEQTLNRLAPAHFTTPLGRDVPIDYEGEAPGIEVRLQEMFGVTVHPVVGPKRLPLRITLLSPGGRPVQVTMDLPGFWTNSYGDVRRDMRGRYPRHPWPDDPRQAEPTVRAKPRGT